MAATKATFALDRRVLVELDTAVAAGAAPSKNAFVERALRRELDEVRREARRRRWEEAAQDPLFMDDLREIQLEFETLDRETARSIG